MQQPACAQRRGRLQRAKGGRAYVQQRSIIRISVGDARQVGHQRAHERSCLTIRGLCEVGE